MGKSTISMAIFNSFWCLPQQKSWPFRGNVRGQTHSLLHQSSKGEEAGLLPRLVASLLLSKKGSHTIAIPIVTFSVGPM